MTVAIVDYGMGNLDSMARAVEECGGVPVVTDDHAAIAAASRIILPGVGAFPDAMANLRNAGLEALLHRLVDQGVALLGVCLGMQLLASRGTEGAETEGLGLIDATVERLVPEAGERIPHVGWNEVRQARPSPLLAGLEDGKDFYFVHSYAVRCADTGDVAATTPYGGGFASVVERGRVWGAQFHPEKSQKAGFRLLANFLAA